MAGYVGAKAKRRKRNIYLFIILLVIFFIIYYLFPTLKLNETPPSETLLPSEAEITSPKINSTLEDLELKIFDKQQKINFRDKQIILLKKEITTLVSEKENLSKVILEQENKLNLLLQNEENVSQINQQINLIKKGNDQEISKLNKKIDSIKIEKDNLLKKINKLDNKNSILFKENQDIIKKIDEYKELNLDLKKNINAQKKIIEDQNLLIESLKDKTHH
tara:strand:- start:912 stop:1571 length:660 start_codon:yes stop_codon:yes gene_type:complete